jgi:hypothetical protein
MELSDETQLVGECSHQSILEVHNMSWSRDQSQAMGSVRATGSQPKVRALGNLQGASEKQKAFLRRSRGIKQRFAADNDKPTKVKTSRDYLCPMKAGFVPRKPRGRSHVVMGKEARDATVRRHEAREAFFAGV